MHKVLIEGKYNDFCSRAPPSDHFLNQNQVKLVPNIATIIMSFLFGNRKTNKVKRGASCPLVKNNLRTKPTRLFSYSCFLFFHAGYRYLIFSFANSSTLNENLNEIDDFRKFLNESKILELSNFRRDSIQLLLLIDKDILQRISIFVPYVSPKGVYF